MPRPERKSFAQIIQDEFSEGPVAAAPVTQREQVYDIDSSKISRHFEPLSVQRARSFTGVEPVISKQNQPTPEAPRLTTDEKIAARRAELDVLSDEELEIAREALFAAESDRRIAAEAEAEAVEGLHGWESYGSLTDEPEAGDADDGSELIETDIFQYLNGAA